MKIKLFIIISFLFLQACHSIPKDFDSIDCSKTQDELNLRYSLFSELNNKEISKRKNLDVPTISDLDELSVFSKIFHAVRLAKKDSKLIAVDLRGHRNVDLGNIVISNIKNEKELESFLKYSKFSQGFFALINFGESKISVFSPLVNKKFPQAMIWRADLQDVELVINVSDSQSLFGNMKFSTGQKVSIIANNISIPYSVDFREAKNLQFHFDKKWIMSVYSIEGSAIVGGKDTNGFFKFVNNKNLRQADLTKFDKSLVKCYLDPNGLKLELFGRHRHPEA